MPKACVKKMLKQGKTPAQAHKLCYPGQEAGTSAKEEQARTMGGMQTTEVGRSKKSRKKRGVGHTNPITSKFHKKYGPK